MKDEIEEDAPESPVELDRSQEPDRGRYALAQALPLLIFTLCAIGVGSVFAVRNFMALRGTAEVLDATAEVCGGVASPVTSPYVADGFSPVVVFRQLQDGRLITDSDLVPETWQTEAVDAIQLVLCIETERRAQRVLCNEQGGNSNYVVPYGRELVVSLRASYTAEVLQTGVISSVPNAPPMGCLPERPANPVPDTAVASAEVQAWLLPFVAP